MVKAGEGAGQDSWVLFLGEGGRKKGVTMVSFSRQISG